MSNQGSTPGPKDRGKAADPEATTVNTPRVKAPLASGRQASGAKPAGSGDRQAANAAGSKPAAKPTSKPAPKASASKGTASKGTAVKAKVSNATEGPRRVRLTLTRVDPFSVMKLSFLVAVAVGIALVVCVALLWSVLNGMHVFDKINQFGSEVAGKESSFDVLGYLEFGKVISLTTVIAVIDIALITALSTLGAFLYNIAASILGGLHVTLTDD